MAERKRTAAQRAEQVALMIVLTVVVWAGFLIVALMGAR